MPQRQAKTTSKSAGLSNSAPALGALTVAVGAIVGIALRNVALAGISLCIGAGGLCGWLLAGSPVLNPRHRP
jgi:hypothetical protein